MVGPGLTKKLSYIDNITTAETSAFVIDRLGYDYAVIDVHMDTSAGTSAATVCRVTESDDATTYTTVAALTGGTATSSTVGFVIPSHTGTTVTAQEVYASFGIDLRARKRYLKVEVTPAAAATVFGVANLFRADEMPDAAGTASTNAAALVIA